MKAYVCGTHWQHECKDVLHRVTMYNSPERLKKEKRCWKQCGIVEIDMKLVRWVEPSTFGDDEKAVEK